MDCKTYRKNVKKIIRSKGDTTYVPFLKVIRVAAYTVGCVLDRDKSPKKS